MLPRLLSTVIIAAAVASATMPAQADSTGFDAIHAKIRVGNKTCFDGHSHSGSGSGPNRKVAEAEALKSWYGYTAGEYGSDWAHIGKAVQRTMNCSPNSGGWSCDLTATPCR